MAELNADVREAVREKYAQAARAVAAIIRARKPATPTSPPACGIRRPSG